jgi:hypothetical protein
MCPRQDDKGLHTRATFSPLRIKPGPLEQARTVHYDRCTHLNGFSGEVADGDVFASVAVAAADGVLVVVAASARRYTFCFAFMALCGRYERGRKKKRRQVKRVVISLFICSLAA